MTIRDLSNTANRPTLLDRRGFVTGLAAGISAAALRASPAAETNTPKYRVAVIGHTGKGNYGHGLDRVWDEIPNTRVVAVADADSKGLAAAIIRERTVRPFLSANDLNRVAGVGPATFDRLKETVEVSSSSVTAPVFTGSSGGACGGGRVEINRASPADLETLPGVGPALAGRIVAARAIRGGFDRPEDLGDVSGIGSVTTTRLAPLICVR